MKLFENEDSLKDDVDGDKEFETVNEFHFLGYMSSVKNERALFALNKFIKSKFLSKKTKIRLYTAI